MLFVFGIFFISGEAVHAENITEGNLKYQLDADNQTAKVIGLADALKDNNPAEITIPASVTTIETGALSNTTLKTVEFEPGSNWDAIQKDGAEITSEAKVYICKYINDAKHNSSRTSEKQNSVKITGCNPLYI